MMEVIVSLFFISIIMTFTLNYARINRETIKRLQRITDQQYQSKDLLYRLKKALLNYEPSDESYTSAHELRFSTFQIYGTNIVLEQIAVSQNNNDIILQTESQSAKRVKVYEGHQISFRYFTDDNELTWLTGNNLFEDNPDFKIAVNIYKGSNCLVSNTIIKN